MLAQGLTNKQIAERLTIEEKTVKHHLTLVYKALGVKNRTQAVVAYLSQGAQEPVTCAAA